MVKSLPPLPSPLLPDIPFNSLPPFQPIDEVARQWLLWRYNTIGVQIHIVPGRPMGANCWAHNAFKRHIRGASDEGRALSRAQLGELSAARQALEGPLRNKCPTRLNNCSLLARPLHQGRMRVRCSQSTVHDRCGPRSDSHFN